MDQIRRGFEKTPPRRSCNPLERPICIANRSRRIRACRTYFVAARERVFGMRCRAEQAAHCGPRSQPGPQKKPFRLAASDRERFLQFASRQMPLESHAAELVETAVGGLG